MIDVRRDDPDRHWQTYVFAVDSVWAGPVLPRMVVAYPCAVVRFQVGQAYLFSWDEAGGGFDHPTEWTSVAWRLGEDDRLDLLSFGPALEDYPAEFREASLEEALKLVAPGTMARQPETPDTSKAAPDPTSSFWSVLLLMLAALLSLRLAGRRGSPT